MGLDWEPPPYPTASAAGDTAVRGPRPVRYGSSARSRAAGPAPPNRRDEQPAPRPARRCRSPDPPRLAVHPGEEVARSDQQPRAVSPAAAGRCRRLLAPRPRRTRKRATWPARWRPSAACLNERPMIATPDSSAGCSPWPWASRTWRSEDFSRILAAEPDLDACALPPGAGPDPARPAPRGTGRPRHPHPEIPERLRAVRPPRHRPRGPRRSRASPCRPGEGELVAAQRPDGAQQSGLD